MRRLRPRPRGHADDGCPPVSRKPHIPSVIALAALVNAGPVSALTTEPADLAALEQAWHGCIREAYDRQQDHGVRAGRERNALDAGKPHEDRDVAALMAARPEDAAMPMGGNARTWAAYVAFAVDPVKAWIDAPRH